MSTQQLRFTLFLALSLSHAPLALAQDIADEEGPADPTQVRLQALEKQLADQRERIDSLEKKDVEVDAEMARKDAQTEAIKEELAGTQETMDMMMASANDTDERRLSIYGFFDVTFLKSWFNSDTSALKTQYPTTSTFMMNNINLYVKSEMTETLEAMLETAFLFSPLGHETNLPADVYVDGRLQPGLIDDSEYERIDTTVKPSATSPEQRYGSIAIIRAYLDWKPRDWFNVRVGQYLTPYGIWNEEHASTVLLGVFYPNFMNWNVIPPTQMGLQLFGRTFWGDNFQLKYAVTFSNGRGPIDTVMDLDENKAVGLRLQGMLTGTGWKITAGGYGYYGEYTDIERRGSAFVNGSGEPVSVNGAPVGASIKVTEKYREVIGTADLSIEYKGVKLFGEYLFRRVDYSENPPMFYVYNFGQNGDFDERYDASFIAQSAYGILAWTLPLDEFIAPVTITPYAGYDWMNSADSFDWMYQKTIRFGLNLRPSPYVSIKGEGMIDLYHETLGGRVTSIAAQLAVSF